MYLCYVGRALEKVYGDDDEVRGACIGAVGNDDNFEDGISEASEELGNLMCNYIGRDW